MDFETLATGGFTPIDHSIISAATAAQNFD